MTRAFSRWRSKWPGDLGRRGFFCSLAGVALAQPGNRPPEISAFDLSLLEEAPTPAELFFVREHFPPPAVAAPAWKLNAAGAALTHTELLSLPRRSFPATMECAENPVGGGMVSHAIWEGPSLSDVLAKAAPPRADARFVTLSGYDGYARTIPLAKALEPTTIVAHRMNGESLTALHGGPARLLLPGWYGMDSIKWLQRIEYVTDAPETPDYRRKTRSLLAGIQTGDPVSVMQVKSVFSRPIDEAWIHGSRFTVRGAAWAGARAIRSVEVSTDDGKSWHPAELSPAERFCWSHWRYTWKMPGAGIHALIVRATDDAGNTQPLSRDSSRADGYEQNACQRITVTAL